MSETLETSDALQEAKNWLAAAEPRWRLQTLQHRARYNLKTGEYKQLPTRIRRFLNGTPVGIKAAVLAVLRESAPYKSPVFDLEDDGLTYMPTSTFIRKDGAEAVTNAKDSTYTIIQDLRLVDETGDVFSFADESSCSQAGESEYRWDEPDVEPCPDGSQGVSYQISNVSRDRETDLFSYQIRKVQALTQHKPFEVTQCDTRKRVSVETWNNVYGTPGDYRWDPVRGASAKIELPEPCDAGGDGLSIALNVTENPDCTFRIEVQMVEALPDDDRQYSVLRDQYKISESRVVSNAFAPLPKEGVEYSGGVIKKYSSEHNEDGTWNNEVSVETERPVPSSTVEFRVLPRFTVRTRVDTNQPEPASGLESGLWGSYKYTRTPGGLFTNEFTEYLRNLIDNLGLTCTDNAFMKTHESQSTVDSVPVGTHVPPAKDGVVTTWTYDTDAEGMVTKRERTESEHTVENAVLRKTWGWLGTTSGFVHRSVTKEVADALLASQDKGTSVEAKMTNGALWDVEVQTFLRLTGEVVGFDCQKTLYQHVHEVASAVAAVGDEASDAGNGFTYRRSFQVDTVTGAITQRDAYTKELEVVESRRSVKVTARGKTVRTTKSNTAAKPADASSVGSSTEFEVTPGGRFNATEEVTIPNPGELGKGCKRDVFQEVDENTSTKSSSSGQHVEAPGGGVYYERRQRLGDDGLWEVSIVKHVEAKNVSDGVDVQVTARGKRKTVRTRQKTVLPAEPGVNDAGKGLTARKTRGGLHDVEETTFEPRTGKSGIVCLSDYFSHSHTNVTLSGASDETELPVGSNGKYFEKSQRLGDDGLWEVSLTEHNEREVTGELDVQVTARGKRKTVIKRQTADEGVEPGVDEAGKGLKRTKTKGGRNNIEVTTFEPRTGANGKHCNKDLFIHTHEVTDLRGAEADGEVQDTADGSGVYRELVQRLGDDGLWEVRTVEHTEKPVASQRVEVNISRAAKIKRITDVQVGNEGSEPAASIANVGKTFIVEKTRGGKRNVTRTEVTPITGNIEVGCERDAFEHRQSTTTAKGGTPSQHVDAAGNGVYKQRTARLNDAGVWEEVEVSNTEEQPSWKSRDYQDAFGSSFSFEEMSHASISGGQGGKQYTEKALIRYVEAQMTKGKRYNVKTVTENPKEVDSGKLHFEKVTSKGLAIYYDFIVFRNSPINKVQGWINWIQGIKYGTWEQGSYANNPSISISPNRFGLWDGSIMLTTTFTPKAWASGGSTTDDNIDENDITVLDVQVSPMNSATKTSDLYLLKAVTEEKHKRGGGVGKDKLKAKISGGTFIRGSTFSYHPSGQAFQYDLIYSKKVKYTIVKCTGDDFEIAAE